MKLKTNLLLFCVFALLFSVAQANSPQAFSYQSVIYNNSGALVTNQTISLQISIIENSETGASVYKETHQVSTNENGMISALIGKGSSTDDFSIIDWGSGDFFIKSEIDINNGTNYTITGIQQLLSVPYALYANNAIEKEYVDDAIDSLGQLIAQLNEYNKPTTSFNASNKLVGLNKSVTFSSASANQATSYLWTFQGGSPTTSTAVSPTVTYNSIGSFDVKLKATNDFGENETNEASYIEVPNIPESQFTASQTSINVGNSVTFTSTSTNTPSEYFWEFNNGSSTTSNEQNPTVTFGFQGSYTVSLTVKNVSGSDKEIKVNYIVVE